MVKIDNTDPHSSNLDNNSGTFTNEHEETKRYQIDPKELTFPIEGMKNAKVVKDDLNKEQPREHPSQTNKQNISSPSKDNKKDDEDPRIKEYERLKRLAYDDQGTKFVHLPDDPAYRPISLEAIMANEFQNEDLKLNTRIMMNIAISDYVIFREIDDNGDVVDNVQRYFRRVRTNEFQEYVDIQTELDDLVKRVGIIEATYPFTLELQDKLYETQKRLIKVARNRIKKGFEIFFKWTKEDREHLETLYNMFDQNDIQFNVDCAFLRITKSPFLRRKSSPSS